MNKFLLKNTIVECKNENCNIIKIDEYKEIKRYYGYSDIKYFDESLFNDFCNKQFFFYLLWEYINICDLCKKNFVFLLWCDVVANKDICIVNNSKKYFFSTFDNNFFFIEIKDFFIKECIEEINYIILNEKNIKFNLLESRNFNISLFLNYIVKNVKKLEDNEIIFVFYVKYYNEFFVYRKINNIYYFFGIFDSLFKEFSLFNYYYIQNIEKNVK